MGLGTGVRDRRVRDGRLRDGRLRGGRRWGGRVWSGRVRGGRVRSWLAAGALLASVATPAAVADAAGTGPAAAPRISLPVETFTLPNGLRVVLSADPHAPTVATSLRFHVGAADETGGHTGFAHLFEHMMFQGSAHIPLGKMDKLTDALGTYTNASTDFDSTTYFIPDLPPDRLALALWFDSDRLGYLLDTLDERNLAIQKAVVRNELRQNDEQAPYGNTELEVYRQLFPAPHPYHDAVIGTHEQVQAATLAEVRRFFRTYYVPNNATLAIAGRLDVPETKKLVTKYFGTLPRGADPPAPAPAVPTVSAEKDVALTDAVTLPRVTMAWLTPPFYAPGDAAADTTAGILAGGESSVLYKALVRGQEIAQDVTAYQASSRFPSVFELTATAKPGHTAAELKAAIDAELAKLRAKGPAQADLDAARNTYLANFVRGLQKPDAVADVLSRYDRFVGTPRYLDKDIARYTGLTVADIKAFATDQLKPDARVVLDTEPGKRMLLPDPKAPPLPAAAPPTAKSKEPWRAKVPGRSAIPAAALPAVRRFTLGNGMAVYLVPSHALPLVTASVVSLYGSATDPAGRPGLASFTAAMLRQGAKGTSAEATAASVAAFGGVLTAGATRDGSTLTLSALSPQRGTVLSMLAALVRHPAFRAGDLARTRSDTVTAITAGRDDPTTVAHGVGRAVVYGAKHPYGHLAVGSAKAVGTITVADVRAFHSRAYTPTSSALVLAGDLTLDQAKKLAGKAFGSWSGSSPRPATPGPAHPARARVALVDTGGAGQTALLFSEPGVARTDPDYYAYRVATQILGGVFSSRLNNNLREVHGYTYGAFASLGGGRGAGPFDAVTSVETRYTGAAVKETLLELGRIRRTDISAEELARGRQSLVGSVPGLFATTEDAVDTVSSLFEQGLPADTYAGLAGRLAALTPARIRAVVARHLDLPALKIVAVGDAAKITPALRKLKLGTIARYRADGRPEG